MSVIGDDKGWKSKFATVGSLDPTAYYSLRSDVAATVENPSPRGSHPSLLAEPRIADLTKQFGSLRQPLLVRHVFVVPTVNSVHSASPLTWGGTGVRCAIVPHTHARARRTRA